MCRQNYTGNECVSEVEADEAKFSTYLKYLKFDGDDSLKLILELCFNGIVCSIQNLCMTGEKVFTLVSRVV